MNSRIDDEMLERLVAYEGYVENLFARAARRRWLEMNIDVEKDYERLKEFKKQISSLVDRAFCRYGVARGLMKIDRTNLVSELDDDLEALAGQLQKAQWNGSCRETDNHVALRC